MYYAAFVSTMHDAEIPGSSLVADRRMFGALLRKEVTAHILTLKARIPSMYQLQAIVLVLVSTPRHIYVAAFADRQTVCRVKRS